MFDGEGGDYTAVVASACSLSVATFARKGVLQKQEEDTLLSSRERFPVLVFGGAPRVSAVPMHGQVSCLQLPPRENADSSRGNSLFVLRTACRPRVVEKIWQREREEASLCCLRVCQLPGPMPSARTSMSFSKGGDFFGRISPSFQFLCLVL